MILMMKIYSIINLHEKLIYLKIINLFFYSISKFDCYSEAELFSDAKFSDAIS
jgi:hypothetical protein